MNHPSRRVAALITFDTTMTDEQIAYVLDNVEVQIVEPVVGYDDDGNEIEPHPYTTACDFFETRTSVNGEALNEATTRDYAGSASSQHYIETGQHLPLPNPLVTLCGNDDGAEIRLDPPIKLIDLVKGV